MSVDAPVGPDGLGSRLAEEDWTPEYRSAPRLHALDVVDEDETVTKRIRVVGAVILRDDHVLCALRGPSGALAGYWEFPGGKIETDETPEAALEREIAEELDCVIRVSDQVTTTVHEYEFGEVTLTTFWCSVISGEPVPREHAELRWVQVDHLHSLHWAPADIPSVRTIAASHI